MRCTCGAHLKLGLLVIPLSPNAVRGSTGRIETTPTRMLRKCIVLLGGTHRGDRVLSMLACL